MGRPYNEKDLNKQRIRALNYGWSSTYINVYHWCNHI